MRRALDVAAALLLATPAMAQDHSHHTGHSMPMPQATEAATADAGDWAADALHDPKAMADARAALFRSTRDSRASLVRLDQLEWRMGKAKDGLAWQGRAWTGGDLDRFLIRSEGAMAGGTVEHGEVRALWSHAIGPYANLETGVRQDFGHGPARTHATIGVDAMLPYWIEAEGAVFLSHKGDVTARVELTHDMRLTNRLILQPRLEADLSAQDVPELGLGSGVTEMSAGLRLRYAIQPRLAPYVGVHRERKFGDTARFARAAGEGTEATSFVAGVFFFF
jgi:copper resistance protein B